MARILRGDVVWAKLDPTIGHEQAGLRPVLILSNDVFNSRSGTVIAVPVTSQEGNVGFPLSMEITSAKLPKRSWAKISQVRTLSTQRIGKRIGSLKAEEVDLVVAGLNEIVGGSAS
jgi:mRNA interferase MazF